MPAGRPSEYDSRYCDDVIEYGRQGKSVTWMAATIGVHKQTLYTWMDTHPEFLDAIKRAKDLCQLWWEDAGQSGMIADKFNATVWAKNMNCRFRDEWTESQNINHGAQDSLTQLLGIIDGKAGRIPSASD